MAKTPTQLRSEAACKTVLKNLERRGFEAFYCSDKHAALVKASELISEELLTDTETEPEIVSEKEVPVSYTGNWTVRCNAKRTL